MSDPEEIIEQPVCAKCFSDEDLVAFIKDWGGPRGCDFCGKKDAPTAPLQDLADHMRACIGEFYGLAHDQLTYESREGGYQGAHWDTSDLLYDQLQLDLPRDSNDLLDELVSAIGDEVWCDYDRSSLDYDVSLRYGWEEFCNLIKHGRRFFFALGKPGHEYSSHPDDYSPLGILSEISRVAEECNLIIARPKGTTFYRARPRQPRQSYESAEDLGPPPPENAVQANRMNPPGIPMLYAAETERIAALETRNKLVSVGKFRAERDFRILNLADLPSIPGFFSGAERKYRLGLKFLHSFAKEIARPVDRTDRIHIDYIPSQVMTEFLRDHHFEGGNLDGIRYPSPLEAKGRNLVLFATQDDLLEPDGTLVSTRDFPVSTPWIKLLRARNLLLK